MMERQMALVQSNMAQMSQTLKRIEDQGTRRSSSFSASQGQASGPTLDQWVKSIDTTAPSMPSLPSIISDPVLEEVSTSQAVDEDNENYLFIAASEVPMKQIIYRDEEERLRQENWTDLAANRTSIENVAAAPLSGMRSMEDGLHRKSRRPVPMRRGNLGASQPDPVAAGFCSEDQGRHLLNL